MKKLLFIVVLIVFFQSFGQEPADHPTIPIHQEDSLRQELDSLPLSVARFQNEVRDLGTGRAAQSSIEATKRRIQTKQVEVINIAAKYTDRFAQGSQSIKTINSAILANVSLGQLSSPFVAPTFKNNYDGWIGKWGKFLPAVILPSLSLLSDDSDLKIASVSAGLTLTTILSAFSKNSNKQMNEDLTNAFAQVTSTMDLFDFNRTVYDDIQKLKAVIRSVEQSDPTLAEELMAYNDKNLDLLTMSDENIIRDPRFKTYVETSTLFYDRFQLKLARMNYVLDYAYGMINSYDERYKLVMTNKASSNAIYDETAKAIAELKSQYATLKKDWDLLQGKFYQLTPTETRKLQGFYNLEEILVSLN